MSEGLYVLDCDESLFIALRIGADGKMRRAAVDPSLDGLVEKCKELRLRLHAVSPRAEQDLFHYITVSQEVEAYLRQRYADHVEAEDGPKPPFGFDLED